MVAWWGGVDNGSIHYRINVATLGGSGRFVTQSNGLDKMTAVFWLDSTKIIAQDNMAGKLTIDMNTGAVHSKAWTSRTWKRCSARQVDMGAAHSPRSGSR